MLLSLTAAACSGSSSDDPAPQGLGGEPEPGYAYQTQADVPIQLVQTVPAETELAVPGLPQAAQVWVEMANAAQKTIDLGQMYVSNSRDGSGPLEPVIRALAAAGERGVKIRFIASKQMQGTDRATLERIRALKGVELRIVDYGRLNGGIQHAKFWVVDGKTSYVGSQNFDHLSLSQIHETGLRIDHVETARRLTQVFEIDWEIALTGKKPVIGAGPPLPKLGTDFEMTASPPEFLPKGMKATLPELVALLKGTKKKLQIQTMIYSPVEYSKGFWNELDQPIRDAAARGVQVELLVAHWNTDEPNVDHLKSLSQVAGVTLKIATIPLLKDGSYTPYSRVNHSKFVIADGAAAMVGTSNWSRGYFYDSRDIEIFTTRASLVAELEQVFGKLWNASFSEPIRVDFKYPKPRKS